MEGGSFGWRGRKVLHNLEPCRGSSAGGDMERRVRGGRGRKPICCLLYIIKIGKKTLKEKVVERKGIIYLQV